MNQPQSISSRYERLFADDLRQYLLYKGKIDERMPECPDLDALWATIGESYLPDGMREFNGGYPTVALGWMMFVGMALAKYWDTDWEVYGKVPDLYAYLRDRIDFDHMDDYITAQVLCLGGEAQKQLSDLVAACASRAYNLLRHQPIESGTEEAFRAFVAALHTMYAMGIAVQLKAMGYHMVRM